MTLPSAKELNEIDMTPVVDLFKPVDEVKFLSMFAGQEHYRLLRWIAENNQHKRIVEIGAYMGLSTVCLAWNDQNFVTSYDGDFSQLKWKETPKNVHCLQTLSDHYFYPGVIYSDIIFVDTWHFGKMEAALYEYLKSFNWKGLLIYDDIFLNDEMSAFWKSVDMEKIDATALGHSYGTGIIEFL